MFISFGQQPFNTRRKVRVQPRLLSLDVTEIGPGFLPIGWDYWRPGDASSPSPLFFYLIESLITSKVLEKGKRGKEDERLPPGPLILNRLGGKCVRIRGLLLPCRAKETVRNRRW